MSLALAICIRAELKLIRLPIEQVVVPLVIFVIINLVVDIIYAFLDPRIHYQGQEDS